MKKIYLLAMPFIALALHAQIPTGYYDGTTGLTGAALKTKLSEIISNGHRDNGYDGLWTAYKTTDTDKTYENDGTILDMYSENPFGKDPYNFMPGSKQCGNYSSEGDCYNREHVVPQSLFGKKAPMVTDVHHIRATDGKVNGMRSNYPYGKVGSASFISRNGSKLGSSASSGFSGTVFEPIDEFKGDIARMILYFVTRYESNLSTFSTENGMLSGARYPGIQKWELDVLLNWAALDPVSAAEVNRNDAAYKYQGNRNPYIDHPEYVSLVFGNTSVVQDLVAPSVPGSPALTAAASTSLTITWGASTDNTGVSTYLVYVNGTLAATTTATTATLSGLAPSTAYNITVSSRDAANNESAKSGVLTASTTAAADAPVTPTSPATPSCGTEDFEKMPDNDSGYENRTWTNNGITWTATASRTDQKIDGRALMTDSNGSATLTSSTLPDGVGSITMTTFRDFTGGSGNLNVYVNGKKVGVIPFSNAVTTTTISNINVSGDAVIKVENPSTTTRNRVSIDNLSWTCYSKLGTSSNAAAEHFSVYPNPVKDGSVYFTGLGTHRDIQIFSTAGQLVLSAKNVADRQKISVKNLSPGFYIVKAGPYSSKLIVK